ncbi:tributyrin esterase [Enterococcus canis]|jgi:Predicted esterase|uniref:Tributyrin esterase n=1 Tax=Enterococcus canis TaxID=214095 RepID=A0A1L8RDL9_9ENTE|nr:alpha/beta hydrolase family protein [Enterococcus canis]OJG17792.1 tributyrin esterase [Enterococcus canis]
MALLEAYVYSNVLEMEVCLNVILPQKTSKKVGTSTTGGSAKLPVLYLLHGMGGNHSVWARRTSIERYVADLGLAVIMPSTDLGWYTDTSYDMKYWTFVSQELPNICHELFPQLSERKEDTFAAGLSMGGYGALKLGLATDQFQAVGSLSGAVNIGYHMQEFVAVRKLAYWEGIFGPLDQVKGSANDLFALAAKKQAPPAIYLACGEQDPLLLANKELTKKLTEWQIPFTFETAPGGHDWLFWDQQIQAFLQWLQPFLPSKK